MGSKVISLLMLSMGFVVSWCSFYQRPLRFNYSLKHLLYWRCEYFKVKNVNSHGRLMDPPARNCMWRFGYSTPVNYDDNQLWCGGRASEAIHFFKFSFKYVACIMILI